MPLISRRLRHTLPLALACLASSAACDLRAQTEVERGDRVRLLAPSAADTLLSGTVIALDSATLLLAPAPNVTFLRVGLDEVQRLEVSRGRAPSTAAGAVTGLVIGAVSGYGLARMMGEEGCEYVCGAAEAGSAVLGGALGLLLGGIVGASTPHGPERWEPVPVDARP